MATVPTLTVGSTNQTAYIHAKTLGFRLKTLDFTLVDPVTTPGLHDIVTLDVPAWRGRVSTIESTPFRAASGTDHRYVKVTATNKHVAAPDTAPFDLSDTPNNTTTFPYRDLVVIRTLEDQTDLSTAELRMTGIVYREGLMPGQTVHVTNAAEGLSAELIYIVEMSVNWLRKDAPEYHFELSDTNTPLPGLGDLIGNSNCDCPQFNADDCVPPDVGGLSCIGRDSNSHSYTEGGQRSPLGLVWNSGDNEYYATSTDFMDYWAGAGGSGAANNYPLPGQTYSVGNGGGGGTTADDCKGTTGGVDYFGSSNEHVTVQVVGPGTLTVQTTAGYPGRSCGDAGTINATAYISGTVTSAATASCATGDDLVIEVPDDSECAHYITMQGALGLGHGWGVAGFNWTPLSTFDVCEPSPGQPILPEHFTGDGSTVVYSLAWPYMPGSLEVLVEGVDWSDQVIEDDPTIGDFSLAYPPPLATDPEPNVEVHYRYPK